MMESVGSSGAGQDQEAHLEHEGQERKQEKGARAFSWGINPEV